MAPAPDPGLLHKAIAGEVVLLHEQHSVALLRYAMSRADCEETARDAVQEAFLRYFVERSYGREITNPRAWLYQVLRNYISDRTNAASAKREDSDADIDGLIGEGRDPEALIERKQTAQEIAKSLSPRELECLQLRTEGRSYEEIATALNVRMGTVGAMLSRVHDKIRKRAASYRGPGMELAAAVCHLAGEGEPFTPS